MAGDWIMMRLDLRDDPAVIAMSGKLGIPREHVVGCLHAVWSWASAQLRNGDARGVTLAYLDQCTGVTDFGSALLDTGWIESDDSGIRIPLFDRWNSQTAKQRALTSRRNAEMRLRKRDAPSVTRASPTVTVTETVEQPPLSPLPGGRPPDSNGRKKQKQKPWEPAHEKTDDLCRLLDRGRRHWNAECATMACSMASRKAMDRLLRGCDAYPARPWEDVRGILRWLFGGEAGDYEPRDAQRFDWRTAVRTAAALERNWDALVNEMRASMEVEA
jgi:hypothetical protein